MHGSVERRDELLWSDFLAFVSTAGKRVRSGPVNRRAPVPSPNPSVFETGQNLADRVGLTYFDMQIVWVNST